MGRRFITLLCIILLASLSMSVPLAVPLASAQAGTTTPGPPLNLTAASYWGVERGIRLSWNPPDIEGGSPVLYYNVYRVQGRPGENLPLLVQGVYGTEYTDTDIELDARYYYQVSAVNSQGEGNRSEMVFWFLNSEEGQSRFGGLGDMFFVCFTFAVIVSFSIIFLAVFYVYMRRFEGRVKRNNRKVQEYYPLWSAFPKKRSGDREGGMG